MKLRLWGKKQPCPAPSPLEPSAAWGLTLNAPMVPGCLWEGLQATLPPEPFLSIDSASIQILIRAPQKPSEGEAAILWFPENLPKCSSRRGHRCETCRGRLRAGVLLGFASGEKHTSGNCWERCRCAERNVSTLSIKIQHNKNNF